MALNIHNLAFILLVVFLKTRQQLEPLTSFNHFPFARFGRPFSVAVACNHCCSCVKFWHLRKIQTFIRSRPSKTLTLHNNNNFIIILSCDIPVNPGPTSIYPCARFGRPFSVAVACNHCCSCVKFWHLTKIQTFIRSRPSKTLTLHNNNNFIIILSGDIPVNPGPTSIYPCGMALIIVNSMVLTIVYSMVPLWSL